MSTGVGVDLRPRISYPRQARAGAKYVISVDLDHALSPDAWPYDREEYPVTCFLDAAPHFTQHAAGDSTIVVHRFGGSYGPARFWLTAGKPGAASIRLTLVNGAGIPVAVRTLDDIRIVESAAPEPRVIEVRDAEATAVAAAVPRSIRDEAPAAATGEGVFRWLHLGDLQFRDARGARWPRIADDLVNTVGTDPIDAVIVTGDLAYAGRAVEFGRAYDFLGTLRHSIAALQGSVPALLVVPGNHDAARHSDASLAFAPTLFVRDPAARAQFWSDATQPARVAVNDAFAEYEASRRKALTTQYTLSGLLPGDFSISLRVRGLRVGVVGLNNAFFPQEGVGDLDEAQLRAVCGDLDQWAAAHDLRLLLTHHPPSALYAATRARFFEDLAPRWLFDVRLYGATHRQPDVIERSQTSSGLSIGCNALRCDGRTGQGYRIGEARLWQHGAVTVRVVSRIESKSNHTFVPQRDHGTMAVDAGPRTARTAVATATRPPSVEPAEPVSVSLAPVARRHALLIGIDRYANDNDALPMLRNGTNDVRLLAPVLERFGYRTSQLLGAEATGAAILAGVRRLCEESEPDDLLLLFFFGEINRRARARGVLVPYGVKQGTESGAVPFGAIFDLAGQHHRRLLLIGDVAGSPDAAAPPFGVGTIGGATFEVDDLKTSLLADALKHAIERASESPLTVGGLATAIQAYTHQGLRATIGAEGKQQGTVVLLDTLIEKLVVAEPAALAAPRQEETTRGWTAPTGYDSAFLDGLDVPLPRVSASTVLNYGHFTVALNPRRRLAYFAAVNVDLERRMRTPRSPDKWVYDERIGPEGQVGHEFYANSPFDRSRLVKRLQPAWGETWLAARAAEQTNTFTNVVPLTRGVNQYKPWLELPDYIARTFARDGRMVMFAGPVFRDDDPVFRGVKVPRSYWRIMAFVQPDGVAMAMAFLVIQNLDAGDDITGREPPKALQQVSIAGIELLTGLSFGRLKDIDVAVSLGIAGGESPIGMVTRPIRALEDIAITGDAVSRPTIGAVAPPAPEPTTDTELPGAVSLRITEQSGSLHIMAMSAAGTQVWRSSPNQLALIDRVLADAALSITLDPRVGGTLFQAIVPTDAQDLIASASMLRLLVDEASAWRAWELLHDPRHEEPLALRYPMIRKSTDPVLPPLDTPLTCKRALVIGPPEAQPFAALPGAISEVERVAKLLTDAGMGVTLLRQPTAVEVMHALHGRPYDLLHIAAHGALDLDVKGTKTSGVVLGDDVFLTTGDVEQIRAVPAFVFLNVEHAAARPRESSGSSLAMSFLKAGSRVVIAPSGLVGDEAAARFATECIAHLFFESRSVPDAVLRARRVMYRLWPGQQGWAIYQCYCDPNARIEFPRPQPPASV